MNDWRAVIRVSKWRAAPTPTVFGRLQDLAGVQLVDGQVPTEGFGDPFGEMFGQCCFSLRGDVAVTVVGCADSTVWDGTHRAMRFHRRPVSFRAVRYFTDFWPCL